MNLVNRGVLDSFVKKHTDTKSWIDAWIKEVEGNIWKTPQDIKNKYASASFLSNHVVIFNVKGVTYRLEVQVAYNTSIVYVLWAGTHAEYDKRNKNRGSDSGGLPLEKINDGKEVKKEKDENKRKDKKRKRRKRRKT